MTLFLVVYKRETQLVGENIAFLVDGTGQGIWEDNECTLLRYLDGELDPESSVNMRLNTLFMKAVDEQIKTIDYVNSKYQELVKKYDDLTARNKIGEVVVTEIYDVMTSGKPSSDSEYKKKIEKIR